MIVAHHLIFTGYGWWLPNDPRGSTSHAIRVERVATLGPNHYGRKAVQPPARELRQFFDKSQSVLQHPALSFGDGEATFIADAFADTTRARRYTCYACAIMADHVHLLVRVHRDKAEEMIRHFQSRSAAALTAAEAVPPEHPVWGGPGWKVFLHSQADVARVIRYIEQNPVKIHQPIQRWPFVVPYDGWLPGIGKPK